MYWIAGATAVVGQARPLQEPSLLWTTPYDQRLPTRLTCAKGHIKIEVPKLDTGASFSWRHLKERMYFRGAGAGRNYPLITYGSKYKVNVVKQLVKSKSMLLSREGYRRILT